MILDIIIPFRGIMLGKQRLAKYLTQDQRKNLLNYLVQHVILAANKIALEHNVYLLTKERAISFDGKYEVLLDKSMETDLNQALTDALQHVLGEYVLIIMADLPYISTELISEIISIVTSENKIVICPSQDKGTSILGFPKKYNFPFCFGNKSSQK